MGADPRSEFLRRLAVAQSAPAPIPLPAVEADTASGDMRLGLARLSERSHATAATVEEIKGAVNDIRRMMTQVAVQANQVQTLDDQANRRIDELIKAQNQLWSAVNGLSKWRANLSGKTAVIVAIADAGAGLVGWGIDHVRFH